MKNKKRELVENVHYYLENGRVVFTETYHKERGKCCGNKCRHCPFYPEHFRGSTKITEKN